MFPFFFLLNGTSGKHFSKFYEAATSRSTLDALLKCGLYTYKRLEPSPVNEAAKRIEKTMNLMVLCSLQMLVD